MLNDMGRKQEKLIAEYWETDRKRKQIENSMINFNSANLEIVANKLKDYMDNIGGTDLQIIAETINPPQITFNLNNKQITTESIYNWNWENVKSVIDANIL
jgi:hypothetical protein